MALSAKRRVLKTYNLRGRGTLEYPPTGYSQDLGSWDATIYSRQITLSEGHRWPKDRSAHDVGEPFDTVRFEYLNRNSRLSFSDVKYGTFRTTFTGNPIPYIGGVPGAFTQSNWGAAYDSYYFSQVPTSGDLVGLGSKFIASALPTNPVVDGSVGLAELFREGLPKMIGSTFVRDRANMFRKLGSEYLNFEFGWKPFVSDLQSAAKAVLESERILANLAKHSGKELHRFRMTPPERTTNVFYSGASPSNLPSEFRGPVTPWYRETSTTYRRQWFSGSFTYHFDPDSMNEVSRIATQARLLYGLDINPEVLWNLAPWSWLVDWVTNVGPLLHNVMAFQRDGLVMHYGYVMEYNSNTLSRRNTIQSSSSFPSVYSDQFRQERKTRIKASPFGFGIDSSAFTNRQWAILGALGITRAPKTL